MCARDADCDFRSACTAAGRCAPLALGGRIACAGGTAVSYRCASEETAASFRVCAGAGGVTDCPFCLDGSCFRPGLCASAADCHAGQDCVRGLCVATPPACGSTVAIESVIGGLYAAGRQVCARGRVQSVRSGYDGMIELRIGVSPYLYLDIPPMVLSTGLALPQPGQTVTAHGTVRWDEGHRDFELSPVDWIGP